MDGFYGPACVVAGTLLAWAGHLLLNRSDRPGTATGFQGPIFGRRLLTTLAATLMLVVGLLLTIVSGLVAFLM
jgi:hypothetical protein